MIKHIIKDEIPIISTTPINLNSSIFLHDEVQGEPGSIFTWYIAGPVGAFVTAFLERVPNTGGHYHGGADRTPIAAGYIFPNNFTLTGTYPQNYAVSQVLPEASGLIKLFSQIANTQFEHTIKVKIEGLIEIIETESLRLKEPEAIHPESYYATPNMISKLSTLASTYHSERGKPITLTDASLEWGGRFDLHMDWNRPHGEHRNGNQADIRSRDMNEADKEAFLRIAANSGLGVLIEGDHWHVRG